MEQQFTMNKKEKREVFKTGRWSSDEESLFEEGLNFFGKDWRKIQRYVKTRSLLQVRSHSQKYFLMVQKIQTMNTKTKTRHQNRQESLKPEIMKQIQEQNEDYFTKVKVQLQNTSNSKTIDQVLTPDCYDFQNTAHEKVVSQENKQFTNTGMGWTPYIPTNTSQSPLIESNYHPINLFHPTISYYNYPPNNFQVFIPSGVFSVFNWNN